MKNNHILLIICAFFIFSNQVYAQSNTVSAGGVASGTGGTVSFTIGQIDYVTANNPTGIITQGLQQPYEIFTVGIDETSAYSNIVAYPNPTTNQITIKLSDKNYKNIVLKLFDINGKEINELQFIENTLDVPFSNLSKGVYIINITEGEKQLKQFKILKNL